MRAIKSGLVAILCSALTACGSSSSPPSATPDSTPDSTPDTPPDGTPIDSTAPDTSTPDATPIDSATPDATPDSPIDAGADAHEGGLPDAQIVEIPVYADPRNIIAGAHDDLWFTECTGNKIGHLTTAGVLTEYPVPTADACPYGIARRTSAVAGGGTIDTIFFTERAGNKIGVISETGVVTEYAIPRAGVCPGGITARPSDSRVWFTEVCNPNVSTMDRIASFDPDVATKFVETSLSNGGTSTTGIASAADGTLWLAERSPTQGRIGRLVVVGGATECGVPQWEAEPFAITVAGDGRVWFTEYAGNMIGVVDPTSFKCLSSAFVEFTIPTTGSKPAGIAVGPACTGAGRAIWFAEEHGAKIGCITPAGVITEHAVPSSAFGITEGPDGNIWFTEPSAAKVGRYRP